MHELVQPTLLREKLRTRAISKMVGTQDNAEVKGWGLELISGQAFDRTLRAHRYEHRCLDNTVWQRQTCSTHAQLRFMTGNNLKSEAAMQCLDAC